MDQQSQIADGTVHVYLLGRFEIRTGDRLLIGPAWNHRKAKALVKLLALQQGRSLHREQVLDALWPELDVQAAANNLHKTLYHLRTVMAGDATAPGLVSIAADRVMLAPSLWIDVEEFRKRAQRARSLQSERTAYEQALALYAGDLLPEDIYEDWAESVREELRSLAIRLLLEVSQLCEQQGEPDIAIEHLQQLLHLDPVYEEAHRGLMRVYARGGSRHRALRQYQSLRKILQRELGVEPSVETETLYHQIVAGSLAAPRGSPPGAPARRRRSSTASTPIIGRERELERADDLLQQVIAGRGQALFVNGQAGIGKSRLVREILGGAEDQGFLTLTGRSFELEASAAYQPLREVLRQVLDDVGDEAALQTLHHSTYLKRLLPDATIEPAPSSDPALLQVELFHEVTRLVSILTAHHPLALFLDDLHAADEASLRLLHYLCRELPRYPVLLVGAYRPEDAGQGQIVEQFRASIRRENLAHEIILGPLPDRAMSLAVEQLFAGSPVERDLVQEIVRSAEGNPFYAAETVRTLQDEGTVRLSDGRWQRRGSSALPIPGSVQDLLDRRVRRLNDRTREVLRLAAVLGRDFDYGVVRHVLEMSEATILDALDDAIASFILEETAESYRFCHSLHQEAIYRRLTRARRQQLHRLVAEALTARVQRQGRTDPETVGYHFALSDEPWRAVPHLQEAGQHASSVFANEHAVSLYEKAIALAESDPNQATLVQAALLEALGDVVRRTGDVARSIPAFERALALYSASNDQQGAVRARGKAALSYIINGDVPAASDRLGATLQAMTDQWPHFVVARTYYLLSQFHWHGGQHLAAMAAAEKALQAAEAAGDVGQRARAYEVLALACHSLGDWQKGIEFELSRHALGVPGFDADEAFDAHL